jgi:hypothetical protein
MREIPGKSGCFQSSLRAAGLCRRFRSTKQPCREGRPLRQFTALHGRTARWQAAEVATLAAAFHQGGLLRKYDGRAPRRYIRSPKL